MHQANVPNQRGFCLRQSGGLDVIGNQQGAVRRCWEESLNLGNVTFFGELYSPDGVHHFGAKPARFGADQWAAMVKAWRTAIPDLHCYIEELVEEGDLVVMRLRFTGTHSAAPLAISGRTAAPRNRTFEEPELLMF